MFIQWLGFLPLSSVLIVGFSALIAAHCLRNAVICLDLFLGGVLGWVCEANGPDGLKVRSLKRIKGSWFSSQEHFLTRFLFSRVFYSFIVSSSAMVGRLEPLECAVMRSAGLNGRVDLSWSSGSGYCSSLWRGVTIASQLQSARTCGGCSWTGLPVCLDMRELVFQACTISVWEKVRLKKVKRSPLCGSV